jgi:hypothetical protein
VTVKHILTKDSLLRPKSSMELSSRHRRRQLPTPWAGGTSASGGGGLRRNVTYSKSQPNLVPRRLPKTPGHQPQPPAQNAQGQQVKPQQHQGGSLKKRQLPKTPSQPPGTIIIVENRVPERHLPGRHFGAKPAKPSAAGAGMESSSLSRCESSATLCHTDDERLRMRIGQGRYHGHGHAHDRRRDRHGYRPAVAGAGDHGGFGRRGSHHHLFRQRAPQTKQPWPPWTPTASPPRRAFSLPRRHAAAASPRPPTGCGRQLPPTPKPSALALHNTPAEQAEATAALLGDPLIPAQVVAPVPSAAAALAARKRELPKPRSLDLRTDPGHDRRPQPRHRRLGRVSSRSMNFPRLERSPSRTGSSLDDLELIPSMPAALRAANRYARRTFFE